MNLNFNILLHSFLISLNLLLDLKMSFGYKNIYRYFQNKYKILRLVSLTLNTILKNKI
jgi:hypothetical protein